MVSLTNLLFGFFFVLFSYFMVIARTRRQVVAVTLAGSEIVMFVASRADTYAPASSRARGPSVTRIGVFARLWGVTTEL